MLSVSGSYLALRGVYLALWASLPQQPDSCPKVFSGNQSSAYSKTAYLTHLKNRADNFGNLGAEDLANKTVISPRSSAPSAMKSRIGQTSQTVPAVNSSKFFSHFPHGTCLLSVSGSYLALRGVYLALWAALPSNPTLGKSRRKRTAALRAYHPLWAVATVKLDFDWPSGSR